MTESRSHKTTSNRIAKKFKTEYNDGKGVDIKSRKEKNQGILSLEVPRHYDQAGSKAELIKTFS